MRSFNSITNAVDMNLSKFQEIAEDRSLVFCSPWGRKQLENA